MICVKYLGEVATSIIRGGGVVCDLERSVYSYRSRV